MADGFRVSGLSLRAYGSQQLRVEGFWVEGSGLQGLGFRVKDYSGLQGLGFRVKDFGLRV